MDKKIGAALLVSALLSFTHSPPAAAHEEWASKLRSRRKSYARGEVGVFVKDLASGETHSAGGEEVWYLASGVKVPIALEVLRQVEEGRFTLEKEIVLREGDFVDGSGETNSLLSGTIINIKYLLEQMLIHSDNTASDLLIREVGLEAVNRNVQRLVPAGFAPITTLADVRRLAYSGLCEGALRLTNPQLLALKKTEGDRARARKLASLLGEKIPRGKTLSGAFRDYYARHLNSATLVAYAELLERIAADEALGPWGTQTLLDMMGRVETGKSRVKAGLGPEIHWAHKTGTQYRRICDFGLAWRKDRPEKKVVLAACAKDFPSVAAAERALKDVGTALRESDLL